MASRDQEQPWPPWRPRGQPTTGVRNHPDTMSPYSSLIDPAEFGVIADSLRNPRLPIFHLLHVKSSAMLAPLAEELHRQRHADIPPWLFPEPVARGLRDGSLLISTGQSRDLLDPKRIVDAKAVPRQALCYVLYSPPFYLVHTPGLFEGTLIKPKKELLPEDLRQKRGPRVKT